MDCKTGTMQKLKTYNIKIKEYQEHGRTYFIVSASLGSLGSITTGGKDLPNACCNLIKALELALEKSDNGKK